MGVLVPSQPYTITQVITNPGAVTNLSIQAGAAKPFVVVRAKITLAQATIPASANARIRLVKKTATPTGLTSINVNTLIDNNPSDNDASFTVGHTATGEGTDADFLEEGWGSTTGWVFDWAPTPEEYIVVPSGTGNGIALKSNVAPPAGVYIFGFTVHEIG